MSVLDKDLKIPEFCELVGISVPQYYVLRKRGTGPKEMRHGPKTIRIRPADLEAWRKSHIAGNSQG